MSKFQYTITKEDEGMTIKALLRNKFSFSSRLLSKLKFQHLVFLNGKEVAGWISPKEGDVLSIKLPEEKTTAVETKTEVKTSFWDRVKNLFH